MNHSPPFVRPDVAALLAAVEAAGNPPVGTLDASATRAMYKEMRGASDTEVGEMAVMRDSSAPGPAGDIALRRFDALAEREAGPIIVYFHGGGFVIGDLDTHASLCAEVARVTGLPVISVAYRLAPEARFPAAPDDCLAVTRWIAAQGDATALILMGDSAGANLAIVTAMTLRDDPAAVPVVAQALLYPVVEPIRGEGSEADFATGHLLTSDAMRWFDAQYGPQVGDVRAYPIGADQAGMPATLVMTASLDPLRDQGRRYAAACILAGVETRYLEAAGTIHGFATMRLMMPSGQEDLASFIAETLRMIER